MRSGWNPGFWKTMEYLTWKFFYGFTAEACGECGAKINIGMGPGWFCPNCNHYNFQCHNQWCIPHKFPNYGPTLGEIKLATRIIRWLRKKNILGEYEEFSTITHRWKFVLLRIIGFTYVERAPRSSFYSPIKPAHMTRWGIKIY